MSNEEFINKKIQLLNINLIATAIYFICLIISFILIYNEKLERQNKKKIFNDNETTNIFFINRLLIFGLVITYLYVDYFNLNLSKERNLNTKNLTIQVEADILALIAALLFLYVSWSDLGKNNFNVSGIENPEL